MRTLFPYAERLGSHSCDSVRPRAALDRCIDLLDPRVVVTLLSVSLPFLAANQFVYGLKVLEIIGGVLLIAGLWCAMSLCCRWRCLPGH